MKPIPVASLPIHLLIAACFAASLAASFAAATGCGEARPPSPAPNPGGAADSGAPDGGASATKPLYAIASRVTLPSSGVTLVAVLDSLEPRPVDTNRTLEIGGFGSAHGNPAAPGALFVGSAEAPTFTKYTVGDDGALAKQETFSLMDYGLKSAPRTVVFVSETKAYAIAAEAYQIFVWNPQTMEVSHVIELPALKREGFQPMWVFKAALREGKLIVPVSWSRVGGEPGSAPESAIVVVDTATDQAEIQEEKRCGGLRAIFGGGNGDLFFSSSAGAPATWRRLYGERGGSEPCLVRMRAGEASLDGGYLGRPSRLNEGRLSVDFSPAGKMRIIFQALDEALFPIQPDSTPEQVWGAAAWRFWSVPLAAVEADAEVTADPVALPASALNALRFEVDGRNFVAQIKADYAETTVVDVTDPANVVSGPTIKGSVGNFFRVR